MDRGDYTPQQPTQPEPQAPYHQSEQPLPPQSPVTLGGAQSPRPSKPSNKGLLIGLIAAGGILLLTALVVVLVIVFGGPTQQDFKEAHTQADNVAAAYEAFNDEVKDFSNQTPRSGELKKSEMRDKLTKYIAEVNMLHKMKAFKDEKAEVLYKDFTLRNEEFVSFYDSFVQSEEEIIESVKNCDSTIISELSNDASKISDSYNELLGPCFKSLEMLTMSENKAVAEYADEMNDAYKEQKSIIKDMQDAYLVKDRVAYDKALASLRVNGSKFTTISNKDPIQEAIDKTQVNKQLNAMNRYLTDRANGKE